MAIVGVSTKKFYLPVNKVKTAVPPSPRDAAVTSPKGTRKKRKKGEDMELEYNVETNNRFHSLSESDDLETGDEGENTAAPTTSTQQQHHKEPKIPPIVMYHFVEAHTQTFNNLRAGLEKDFDLKYKGDRVIIKPSTKSDYQTIINALKSNNLEYHTYTPKEDKEPRLIVKNIPPNVTTEEVQQDLLKQGLKVKKVTQMHKKTQGEGTEVNNRLLYPMFIATFDKNTTFTEVNKHNKVCHCIVKWEKFRNVSGVTQCYNCQSFGHIATNCQRKSKCVKCGETHNTRDCKKTPEQPPKCYNCNSAHPANYRQCPVYARQIELKSTSSSSTQPRPRESQQTTHSTRVYNQSEFPPLRQHRDDSTTSNTPNQAATTSTWPRQQDENQQSESPSPSFTTIISELRSLLGGFDLNKIKNTIQLTVSKMSSAKDSISKIAILFEGFLALFP